MITPSKHPKASGKASEWIPGKGGWDSWNSCDRKAIIALLNSEHCDTISQGSAVSRVNNFPNLRHSLCKRV
jgi:hypothetical protein